MDIDALRHNLRPLNLSDAYECSDEERGYFDYYGINFSKSLDRVTHHFGYIAYNDARIACHYFENAGAERTCFVVHGYLDHVGLYKKIIDYLLHRGCNVVAFDFPGHGLSSGKRASIDSFGDYVLVLRCCLEFFYKKTPSPWHVVAQSMGGAVVMDYLLSQQYDESTGPFDKVLLLAPLVRPAKWMTVKFFHRMLKGWMPSVKRRFSSNSHDKEFLKFLKEQDPLQAKRIPAKWVTSMLRWERRFKDLSWGENNVLILQGDGDETVDWEHNPQRIIEKFPKAKLMMIKDAKHHLVNESDKYFQRVTQAADIYFERRIKPR